VPFLLALLAIVAAWAWWYGGDDDDADDDGAPGFLRRRSPNALAAAAARAHGVPSFPTPDTTKRTPFATNGGGRVQLRVRLDGAAPVPVDHDAAARDVSCPGTVIDSGVRVSRDSGVVGALVWIDGAPVARERWRRAARRTLVSWQDCHPTPALQVAPPGATIELVQRDSIRDTIVVQHVLRARADTIVFSIDGQLVPLHTGDWPPGAVTLRSLRFPWSRAIVFLAPNPTARLSDGAGVVVLDSLAPGEHVVRAWHSRLGSARTRVTVDARRPATATITFRGR
jgi:hypothetical protein